MARRRSGGAALKRLFDSAPQPVYAVDNKRCIVYCNPACAAWTGVPIDSLAGARCDFHSAPQSDSAARAAAAMCPPPQALLGEPCKATIALADGEDRLTCRKATFVPLGEQEDNCAGVVALVSGRESSRDEDADEDEQARLHAALAAIRFEIGNRYTLDQLVGKSPSIRRVREQIRLALGGVGRVLVVGPPGSGREHVARTIYFTGDDEITGMLVPLSCSLLDAELLQTTMTAFIQQYPEIDLRSPAALMLLDVDELSADAQVALMGVLDIVEFELNTIATARQSLLSLAEEGRFRRDLAHALSTLEINLAPLSERREDIPLLAQAVLEDRNAVGEKQLAGFAPEAIEQLISHPYEQNMDELRELVGDACERASGPLVTADDLPDSIRLTLDRDAFPSRRPEEIELDGLLAEIEGELIGRALRQAKGNRSQAARLLGISRARLLRRMDHFQLGDDR